jgi:hypothetical protein
MNEEKKKSLDTIGFYFLMSLIGLSVLSVVGYLFYTLIFG